MKRAEQLQKLSREHNGSLVMAKKITKVVENGSDEELLDAIALVKKYNDDELEEHFQHEEHTIFAPIFKEFKEHVELAKPLLKEHGYLRMLIPQMTPETARQDLAEFAVILERHTRIEERELFPIIESLFTDEQMDAVLNFKPFN
ncbi:MAG: hemerythrin domain-containing protein [Cocleimonas sp.]|nr:hemerythrin domain-containing protein [Cocleimonas sp.]